jgi:hypothetical protein
MMKTGNYPALCGADRRGPSHFMPKRTDLKKIMIIGSGPIVIGQACEFDYSGTQACKACAAKDTKSSW